MLSISADSCLAHVHLAAARCQCHTNHSLVALAFDLLGGSASAAACTGSAGTISSLSLSPSISADSCLEPCSISAAAQYLFRNSSLQLHARCCYCHLHPVVLTLLLPSAPLCSCTLLLVLSHRCHIHPINSLRCAPQDSSDSFAGTVERILLSSVLELLDLLSAKSLAHALLP